jgi:hypothetical protein
MLFTQQALLWFSHFVIALKIKIIIFQDTVIKYKIMANNTNSTTSPYDYSIPITYWIYLVQGSFIVISNSLIFAAILKYAALRKKKVCG